MPRPRKELVNVEETPFYHVSSRCVRRAYLCGEDKDTGASYEHRKQWIEDRIHLLSTLFTIDICSYAVMSNHYHLVLKLSPNQADEWSDLAVLQRWRCLFKGSRLVQRFFKEEVLRKEELKALNKTIAVYRERLTNLSWFMRSLNEPIARQANKEDGCTGHFWESRFISQGLASEQDLLTCMAYVDLNPVRAQMADTPEDSEHTSIKERLTPTFDLRSAVKSQLANASLREFSLEVKPLLAFQDQSDSACDTNNVIPFNFTAYLQLLDLTGRTHRAGKRGAIPASTPPILKRLQLDSARWINYSSHFEALYRQGVFRRAS